MMTKQIHLVKKTVQTDAVCEGLTKFLASNYGLYLLAQNFHWNVKGDNFVSYHALFEDQYKDLAAAIDEIAERIRALDCYAPGSFSHFQAMSDVEEVDKYCDTKTMLKKLIKGHGIVIDLARQVLRMAEEDKDDGTVDLLSSRIRQHEKTLWMLRSSLDK